MFEMSLKKLIFLNVIFGGITYMLLNIIGLSINLNTITMPCITVLGMPGVILIMALKFIFKIF